MALPNAAQLPDRINKRHDTYQPVTGTVYNEDGAPADLRGASLRFLARSIDSQVPVLIIGATTADGVCVVAEDADGSAANVQFVLNGGGTVNLPANRGQWRFTPTANGVSAVGIYEVEIEATMPNGKQWTFPNVEQSNPIWRIDADIA